MLSAGYLVWLFCRQISRILAENDIKITIGHEDEYYTLTICDESKLIFDDSVVRVYYDGKLMGQIDLGTKSMSSICDDGAEEIVLKFFGWQEQSHEDTVKDTENSED